MKVLKIAALAGTLALAFCATAPAQAADMPPQPGMMMAHPGPGSMMHGPMRHHRMMGHGMMHHGMMHHGMMRHGMMRHHGMHHGMMRHHMGRPMHRGMMQPM